jgi:HK97 family phage portal protein
MFGGNGSPPPPGWSGGHVSREDAQGVPAAFRAVALAAEQVSSMTPGVYRGDGIDRIPVTSTSVARFFAGQPNDDEPWESVWSQTEASLTAENNAYWWLTYDSGMRVVKVQVVDPALVEPKRGARGEKVFDVHTGTGVRQVDTGTILHFRGAGNPGQLMAPNPVEVFVDALGSAVARQRYESGFYDRGLSQAMAVTFPESLSAEQVDAYRSLMQDKHGGVGNAHRVRVFGGGATVQTVGISLRDAQFIEGMQFSVEDVSRIYNVTASLLGSDAKNLAGLKPEHEMTRWLRFGLAPRLKRIESAINHHPAFFGVGARDEFQFETNGVLRGDVATEDQIGHQRVQSGRITANEWRASVGLAPLPGGDVLLLTPAGAAPNPDAGANVEGDAQAATAARGRSRETIVLREVEHRTERVERAVDNVTVHVSPTPVEVNVAAPNVQVDAPVQVDVEVPANRSVRFGRNQNGQIINAEIIEE